MAVDRISTLPDEVLHDILSFLPTQMAEATSILSVPALFFNDLSYLLNKKRYHHFTKSIYAAIVIREVPIKTFRLRASNADLSEFDIKTWVNTAIQLGLENLYIHLPHRDCGLSFCCKTLVVLNLAELKMDQFSSVDLPSLKTLHLDNVIFPDPMCLGDLLVACPILEYMHIRHINYYHFDVNVDYYIPNDKSFGSLSKLVRADIHDIAFYSIVECLGIHKYLEDIPLFPNLTHMELICEYFRYGVASGTCNAQAVPYASIFCP